jgi:hypothetical protein
LERGLGGEARKWLQYLVDTLLKLALLAFVAFCTGCGSNGNTSQPGAVASVFPAGSAAGSRVRSKKTGLFSTEQRKLGADEVRVALLVIPGDVVVEVDKVPVRRRNGLIELMGKVGDEHRVRVLLGATPSEEKVVKIEATGTSPALIDANEFSVGKSGPAKTPVVFDVNE